MNTGGIALLQRISIVVLAAAVLGLPINDRPGFFLIALVTFCVCAGAVRHWSRYWLGAVAITLLAVGVRIVLPPRRSRKATTSFCRRPPARF